MNKHVFGYLPCWYSYWRSGLRKDEIGNTATEALAGEWKVTVDAVE